MCGIHLILDKASLLKEQTMQQMVKASAHRGPDGAFVEKRSIGEMTLWMGFNYLNITTRHASAPQPFSNEMDEQHLLFNGEIYNAPELKNRLLENGNHFKTGADTEVLFEWLLEKGSEGLSSLNGMYSLAWADRKSQSLWIARDQSGQKPLFYAESDQFIVVSSEVRAIVASQLIPFSISKAAVQHFAAYKYTGRSTPIFEGIKSLEPGKCLDLLKGKEGKIPSPVPPAWASKDLILQGKELLTDTVLAHLQGFQPAGLFLSGGVDSTLLLALLHKEGIHPHSFYIGPKPPKKETLLAEKAALQYKAFFYPVFISPEEVRAQFHEYVAALDQPIGDAAGFLIWRLCQEARRKTRTVLTGAGADELFGGYRRHEALWFYEQKQKLLRRTKRFMEQLHLTGLLPQDFQKFFIDLTPDLQRTFQHFSQLQWPDGQHFPAEETAEEENPVAWALHHDRSHYLVEDVLALSDQMGMQQGMEMRAPFLDQKVVAWAEQISVNEKWAKGPKWILKQMLEDQGGKAYSRQKKQGFGLPLNEWFRKTVLQELLDELADPKQGIYESIPYNRVIKVKEAHLKGKGNYGPLLWSLVTMAVWLKTKVPAA